ncbi:MAG: hypothetical protein HC912_06390 [Saprospiraceae bacterium]|nr:hypothetical protein [Saprospiraceae bacterium]
METAGQELATENPNLEKASRDFEKEWRDIQSRYSKLKEDFQKVGESSTNYFTQLEELSSGIYNEKLRNEELAKNKELEQRWQKTYEQASINIEKVTSVLESGNDFHRVLVASSIRQKLDQNVEELNRIAAQAKELLSELEVFTEEGRKIGTRISKVMISGNFYVMYATERDKTDTMKSSGLIVVSYMTKCIKSNT